MSVAQTAATAAADHHPLVAGHEIGDQVGGRQVAHHRPRRNQQIQVLARLAVPLRPLTASPGLGPEVVPEAVVAQHRLARVDAEIDAAAASAVAAVWPAARDVRLAAESSTPRRHRRRRERLS